MGDQPLPKGHIRGIDGLRAVSILMVLYAHLAPLLPHAIRMSTLGGAGVTIFFVISGYVITLQLMKERQKTGSVHFGYFLLRRALRLVPAMVVFVLSVLLMQKMGLARVQTPDLIHAWTYTMDFYHPHFPTLGHLWSLSIEEQFYFLWPLLFIFSRRRGLPFAIGALLLCPIARAWDLYTGVPYPVFRFEFAADALSMGCILALTGLPKRLSNLSLKTVAAAAIVLVACCAVSRWWPNSDVLGSSVQALCAAVFVCYVSSPRPQNLFLKVMTSRPAVWLGTVSYSLYLWQEVFTMPCVPGGQNGTELTRPAGMFFHLPLNLFAALLMACSSHYLIERPIREWGRRFQVRPRSIAPSALPEMLVLDESFTADLARSLDPGHVIDLTRLTDDQPQREQPTR